MKDSRGNHFKSAVIIIGFLFIFFLGLENLANARAGSGRSSGSRGFSSGSSYQQSAPGRSFPQRSAPQAPPLQSPMSQPSLGKTFLSGLGGGLVGGMLGSMLFGGRSHAGGYGYGGGGGFGFGDFILLLIVCGIAYFVYKRYRARKQAMEMSGAGGASYASVSYGYNYDPPSEPYYASQSEQQDPVSGGLRSIRASDPSFEEHNFKETVEDNFFRIQSAWGKRDLSGVRPLLAPRMAEIFQEDITGYISRKQFNRLENIAVRQVEIVNAAQQEGTDYITVKFLASLLDYVIDETTNQVMSGSSTDPVKFLEYWTFTRRTGERGWVLAGITQEGEY